MKTYKKWIKSNLDLNEYLTEPCEIDEELYLYLAEVVSPQYSDGKLIQTGEAEYTEDSVLFYMSASHIGDKYFYLGILPEFVQ
jgi:hypothetical protein